MSDLNALLEMGFPKNRAEKALAKTQYKGAQQAMDWLFSHEEDADIDEPFQAPQGNTLGSKTSGESAMETDAPTGAPTTDDVSVSTQESTAGGDNDQTQPPPQAQSFKCDECGKLLRSNDEVQFHAAKTQHTGFSESTEEVKPLTAEEKKEQLAKLQVRLKQSRMEKEQQERKEEKAREKQRRTFGKDVVASKEKMAEIEMRKIAEERRREKNEEKIARQKVLEKIEKDKRDRAARLAKSPTTAAPTASSPSVATSQPAAPTEKKEYTETKLQIRLTNGEALTQTFQAKEPLAAVRLFVEMNRTDPKGNFSLMTTFPRKVFSGDDFDKPLTQLGLVPSAVLMVTKAQ